MDGKNIIGFFYLISRKKNYTNNAKIWKEKNASCEKSPKKYRKNTHAVNCDKKYARKNDKNKDFFKFSSAKPYNTKIPNFFVISSFSLFPLILILELFFF